MSILCQRLRVANAVIAGAGFERIVEVQGTESSVTAGAASADCEAFGIDTAVVSKESGAIQTIVDVNNAPLALQPFAVGAAIPGATTVVHVENGEAAAGPVLGLPVQC